MAPLTTPPAHVVVIEDDPRLAQMLASELRLEGYQVTVCEHGLVGLEQVRTLQPDVVILDWMLPGLSGLDLCMRLRATPFHKPIIMLTAKDEIPDRVAGLNAGADDYVVKPFSLEELLARIKAHLRRTLPDQSDHLSFADLRLNTLTRQVYRQQSPIELTAKEFDLLVYLLRHPNQVLTREQILQQVWGYDFLGESNIIEVYVRALRIKLEMSNPKRLIHTVRGVGYVLREQP